MKSYTNEWLSLPPPPALAVSGAAVLPLLSPDRLDPLAKQAVEDFLREGESENTVRSYRAALRYWAGWFSLRYGTAIGLPVEPSVVLQFIVDHAERATSSGVVHELPPQADEALVKARLKAKPGPLALATLEHRLAVLSKVHQVRNHANPCQALPVRELMHRVRRAYSRRGVHQKSAPALVKEPLEALLQTCDETLIGVRDRALLLFAWSSGGRRRSEVAEASMRHLQCVAPDRYVYELHLSKTDQAGEQVEGRSKPIVGRAAYALTAWLTASGVREGEIFRRVRRGGHVGGPLSGSAIRDIVRQRAALAGLSDSGYSAHSLRSGFVTEAVRQNVPLPQAMALTGHRSVSTFKRYFQEGLEDSPALWLLE